MISILLLILLCTPMFLCTYNPNCTSDTVCSCDLKGAWLMDLTGFLSLRGHTYIDTVGSDSNTYRFYPCGIGEQQPWGNGTCNTDDTMCMRSSVNGSIYSIGKSRNYRVVQAISNGIRSHLRFEYIWGSAVGAWNRTSTVKVVCSKNEGLTYLNEDPGLVFNLVLNTPWVCPYYDKVSTDTIEKVAGLDL